MKGKGHCPPLDRQRTKPLSREALGHQRRKQRKHALRSAHPLRSLKADLDVMTRGQNMIVKQLQAEMKASPRTFMLQAKRGPLPNARTAMLQLRFGGATARFVSTLVRRWAGTDRKHMSASLRFANADERHLQSAITSVAGGKAMREHDCPHTIPRCSDGNAWLWTACQANSCPVNGVTSAHTS